MILQLLSDRINDKSQLNLYVESLSCNSNNEILQSSVTKILADNSNTDYISDIITAIYVSDYEPKSDIVVDLFINNAIEIATRFVILHFD